MTHASSKGRGVAARAYDVLYLEDAMSCLACFFDYAAWDYGAEGFEVANLFASSRLARQFETGAPWAVSGRSGIELFWDMCGELGYDDEQAMIEQGFRPDRTPEYWAGWIAAYVQWRFALTFRTVFDVLPFDVLVDLYDPWHEASEERVARLFAERMTSYRGQTNLARMRSACGYTQRELAEISGVSLRSIQMYEQRNKDINRAQASAVAQIARVLHCRVEDLLEPVVAVA